MGQRKIYDRILFWQTQNWICFFAVRVGLNCHMPFCNMELGSFWLFGNWVCFAFFGFDLQVSGAI
jgi:hypothetical protein